MKILIDIPEETYVEIKNDYTCSDLHKQSNIMYQAIHEGYLIDKDDNYHNGWLDQNHIKENKKNESKN